MSTILLLLIPAVIVNCLPQQSLVSSPLKDNYCVHPCARNCSPQCLPSCCKGTPALPSDVGIIPPSHSTNLCVNPCPRSCSPQCVPNCCAAPKPDVVIASVEEGETEECGDKGFGSPTDQSQDPPGTITIPLPSTMYTPPKPGESPQELPLPDFHIPASILQGIPPSKSMTLTPDGVPSAPVCTGLANVKLSPMVPPMISKPVPPVLPPPPPPPAPPFIAHVSGNLLPYPKLPPVTVSEIPNRVNRLPPLLFPKFSKPRLVQLPPPPVISLPKPPPIHLSVGTPENIAVTSAAVPAAHASAVAPPPPAPMAVAAPCEAPCKPPPDPIVRKMEQELDARFGVSYGRRLGT